MATKKYDAVATVGEYKNRDGDTKKRYVNVGAVFENDDGHLSLKLETIPVGPNWSGWVSFFVPKERGTSAPVSATESGAVRGSDFDGDIPFLDPYKFNWRTV